MRKIFLSIFILVFIATLPGLISLINHGPRLQTDLLGLLPEKTENALVQAASEQLREPYGDAFIFVLTGDNQQALINAAQHTRQLIQHSEFAKLDNPSLLAEKNFTYLKQLKDYRFQLLGAQQKRQIESGNSQQLLQQATADLYSPASLGGIATLQEDPLNLFNRYIEQGPQQPGDSTLIDAGLLLTAENGSQALVINGLVVPGAFNLEAQQNLAAIGHQLASFLATQQQGIGLLRAGAVFHAAEAAATAKREITLIAGGSFIGIVLLFLTSFRSIKALLLSLGSIGFGVYCAFIFSQLMFDRIHLLTLVFGASLIGVAVDYALHYLSRAGDSTEQNREQNSQTLIKRMLPSLGMGLLTSLIGYSSLLQAPLPGLQQMALFSMIGLAAAWLFVVALFPLISRPVTRRPAPQLQWLASVPYRGWRHCKKSTLMGMAIIMVAMLIAGLSQIRASTDIRVLHTPNVELLAQQQQINELLPAYAPNQFFLISDASVEGALQAAADFKSQLTQLQEQGVITHHQLLSDYLPPLRQQQQNYQLLQSSLYAVDGVADQFLRAIGFDKTAIDDFHHSVNRRADQTLGLQQWLQLAPDQQRLLWLGEIDGQFSSIVLLQGVSDLEALERSAEQAPGVRFVDTVADISDLLDQKRQSASRLLIVAYAAITLLLLLRYRSAQALRLVAIPLLSSLLTLALLATAGIAINLFHIFALFLVLGLGMDYSIFLHEAKQDRQPCLLAILLSAITSCLSFGLLALSSTAMISAFGITVLIGSVLNWLLVPLINRK